MVILSAAATLLALVEGRVKVPTDAQFFCYIGRRKIESLTIHHFDKRFGKGTTTIGGHPNSGRYWSTDQVHIFADGWVVQDGSYLLESIEFTKRSDKQSGSKFALSDWCSRNLGWPKVFSDSKLDTVGNFDAKRIIVNQQVKKAKHWIVAEHFGFDKKVESIQLRLTYVRNELDSVRVDVIRHFD